MTKKMTTFIAVCLFATATAFADVQVNDTNFPCENFRNWILAQPWGSDGVITDAEIAGITSINVNSRNISDLTGINFFTNLTVLDAGNNQVTSFDVSNLTNLTMLNVGVNQLTSIDVSSLTNLTYLNVSGNQLTSLDVSNLTNLTGSLRVSSNQLTSIDVSNLTNLAILYVSSNQLTSLDVSNLQNLTTLRAGNNQLTSIDVSNLANLQVLDILSNQLTSIDVSNLANLQVLDINSNQLTSLNLPELPSFTGLRVDNNQLTSLDVSNLANLQALFVQNNQLTSLNVLNLTNLVWLDAQNNQLTSLDLTGLDNLTIFSGTGQNPTLTLLGADNNYRVAVALNNPTNLVAGLSFYNGILTSTDSTIVSSPFLVETGHLNPNFRLSGILHLLYDTHTATPTEDGVTIEWVHVEGAEYYIIVVYADAERTIVLFTIKIDAQGNILPLPHKSRSGAPLLSYTITGLDSNTQFFYSITAFNDADEVINVSTGSFTTLVPTSVPEISVNRTPVAFYTITGVRLGQKPQSGIFIILYCDGSAERVMR